MMNNSLRTLAAGTALGLLFVAATGISLPAAEPTDPAAAILPALNTAPGPEYADEARMFQGIPGIERAANGRLWATWYGGGVTEDRHNYILLVTSGDDGRTWSRPVMILDPDRDGPVRAFDPCLWHDPQGRLWLFWAQRGNGAAELLAITTDDSGAERPKWSEPRWICDGIMMNKPTVASDGRWLLPVAIWGTDASCPVVASADQGATWKLVGAAGVPRKEDRNCDEPMIVERRDGSLWMLVRTRYGIGESLSTDGGVTWTAVAPTDLVHPAARFFIRRLRCGKLLLVKHSPPNGGRARSHLTAYLSDNDGKSWNGGLLLDARGGVSYPDGAEGPEGVVYVIYDFDRQGDKEILMAAFTEDDVMAGKIVSSHGRLHVRINQATGENPGRRRRKIELSANTDGQPLLTGPAAAVEPGDTERDQLLPGAKIFTNRTYVIASVPEALRGKKFLRASIDRVSVVCRKKGIVYVLTPSQGRNRDSLAPVLPDKGFQRSNVPEFLLFEGEANACSVFQKQVEAGETIELGKWGVLVCD